MSDATHGYVGTDTCGCRVFVTTDCGDKRTARDVAKAIRWGLSIHRELIEDFRKLPFGHKCGKESAKKTRRTKKAEPALFA